MDMINELQKKQERLLALAKELERAKLYENSRYHVFEDDIVNADNNWTREFNCPVCYSKVKGELVDFRDYRYYLVEIKSGRVLCYGRKNRIKSYISLHGIVSTDIFSEVDFI